MQILTAVVAVCTSSGAKNECIFRGSLRFNRFRFLRVIVTRVTNLKPTQKVVKRLKESALFVSGSLKKKKVVVQDHIPK